MIYLDYPATTPVEQEVQQFQNQVENQFFANTESNHGLASQAKRFYQRLEKDIEKMISSQFTYTFTSGATEANNMGIKGLLKRRRQFGKTILVLPIEHASVNETVKQLKEDGMNIQYIPVDSRGVIRLDVLQAQLNTDVNMVIAMSVNNEIGVVQPYKEIRRLINELSPRTLFFSDCVQALAKFDIDYNVFDAFSASAHKLYGPKGIGILAIKKNLTCVSDRVGGKHQEGRRAGTIPLPLIAGMTKAIAVISKKQKIDFDYVSNLYVQLAEALKKRGFVTRTKDEYQSPFIFSCYHLGLKAIPLQKILSDKEIYIGTQSSCSEGANKQSAVLTAIGLSSDESGSVIRIGLSPKTTQEEITLLIKEIDVALEKYSV